MQTKNSLIKKEKFAPKNVLYQQYINSSTWQMRKALFFKKNAYQCIACRKTSGIELHHRTYINLTRELDQGLRSLCINCHKMVHQLERSIKLDLATATDAVIDGYHRKQTYRVKESKPFVRTKGYSSIDVAFAQVRGSKLLPGQYSPPSRIA